MEDEAVNALADALMEQYSFISKHSEDARSYTTQLRDDTISIAKVVRQFAPNYDMDEFYNRAGYTGGHPHHP